MLFKPVLSLFLINTKTKNNFSKTILFLSEILLKLKLNLKVFRNITKTKNTSEILLKLKLKLRNLAKTKNTSEI